ncbi:Vitamin K-dependent gamma-carboxylase, partial [Lamprotornis superbus]
RRRGGPGPGRWRRVRSVAWRSVAWRGGDPRHPREPGPARRRRPERGEAAGPPPSPTGSSKSSGTGPGLARRLLGFELRDLTRWHRFVRLLHRPQDPAALGAFRAAFGLLMALDVPQERGLGHLDQRYLDGLEVCRFPLLPFLQPLPLDWMYLLYTIMFLGDIPVALCTHLVGPVLVSPLGTLSPACPRGAVTRVLTALAMDDSGLVPPCPGSPMSSQVRGWALPSAEAERPCAAVELHPAACPGGCPCPRTPGTPWGPQDPLTLIPQVFIVYFIAGLKKLDADWVGGFSMGTLARHWLFAPFRLVLSEELTSRLVVHGGGLVLDLSAGFLLFFDTTRPLALVFVTYFHCMNSQLFSIGMFSYTMLATNGLFCRPEWPRGLLACCPPWLQGWLPSTKPPQPSPDCHYGGRGARGGLRPRQHLAAAFTILYVLEQLFLPYSHFITQVGMAGRDWGDKGVVR